MCFVLKCLKAEEGRWPKYKRMLAEGRDRTSIAIQTNKTCTFQAVQRWMTDCSPWSLRSRKTHQSTRISHGLCGPLRGMLTPLISLASSVSLRLISNFRCCFALVLSVPLGKKFVFLPFLTKTLPPKGRGERAGWGGYPTQAYSCVVSRATHTPRHFHTFTHCSSPSVTVWHSLATLVGTGGETKPPPASYAGGSHSFTHFTVLYDLLIDTQTLTQTPGYLQQLGGHKRNIRITRTWVRN